MKRPARTVRRQSETERGRPRDRSGPKQIDRHLSQILVNVAQLILRNGYGFRRFNKLARQAFVEAAVALDSGSAPRPTTARIAAVTGLTRTEVSQLRRAESDWRSGERTPSNRAIRVASGWSSDPTFLGRRDRIMRLPFDKAGASFTKLVKKYSGDIPARAMLVEMKRLGMVRETSQGTVELVREDIRTARSTIAAMRAISPWVNFFGKAGCDGADEVLTSTARQLRIHFESLPQVYAAVRELEHRRESFVAGLELLATRPKKNAEYELTISVAVAAEKPLRAKKASR
jgi:Family of unknown function (DUF6502)